MKQNKILIINPPRVNGINVRRDERSADILENEVSPFYQGAVLAEYLRINHSATVKLLDANGLDLDLPEVEAWVKKNLPADFAVIKAADDTILEDAKAARICKESGLVTFFWEPILSPAEPDKVLELINRDGQVIDYLILGEAELTVGDYLITGERAAGLAFRRNGETVINRRSEQERLLDLEKLPIPDFNDLPVDKYQAWFGAGPWMTLFTSRGCSGNCVYCLIGGSTVFRGYGRRVRLMSAERILKEVKILLKEFGVRHITFWDDNFTVDRARVMEFCRLIKENNLIFDWSCMSRVDTIDENLIREMREAGLKRIGFGVESGSQKILDSIPKHVTVADNYRAIALAKKFNIWVWIYLVIGLPEESEQTIEETVAFIKKARPDFLFLGSNTPFPGTLNFETCQQLGLIRGDIMEKISAGNIITGSSVTAASKYLSLEQIESAKRKIHRAFLLSSPKIWLTKIWQNRHRLNWKYLRGKFNYFILNK